MVYVTKDSLSETRVKYEIGPRAGSMHVSEQFLSRITVFIN